MIRCVERYGLVSLEKNLSGLTQRMVLFLKSRCHVGERRSLRGFTLIEALVVILIVSILSGAGAWLMAYVVKNAVVIPNQLNMDKLACDALRIMIEGDSSAKGLRFSRAITSAQSNRVDFINQDGVSVYYRLNTGTNKLYRSINGGLENVLPFYAGASGISLSSPSGALFTYYDANEATTAIAANVRRLKIALISKTGTGAYENWEGQSEQASSIAVKRFQ